MTVLASAGGWTASLQVPSSPQPIVIDTVSVPLNPKDPTIEALGDFRYAGGLWLTSRQTDQLHELSDIVISGEDRLTAVGDGGVLLEARLVLDGKGRLVGVADGTLTRLRGQDGRPLANADADAEGLTQLPDGNRLVSFEKHPRIWLYPRGGGPPRPVPSPPASFAWNAGMEALSADPEAGADAYVVGAEESGETWTCRVTAPCVKGATVNKGHEFGLVSLDRLSSVMTAYLLRAYDPVRRNRITLEVLQHTKLVARLELAPPMTVDNFEGLASVPRAGGRRFYLVSDDNNRTTQRTLLLAFDWQPASR
jgi:hypothetical protein